MSRTAIGVLFGVCLLVYFSLSFVVIQPIKRLPEGATILRWRTGQLDFIDSLDGVCMRINEGKVNLLCRGMVMATLKPENIIARLPYSDTLYLFSTGGKRLEK